MSYSLIITIVSHGKADLVTLAATQAGSTGGTVLRGRGISPNAIAAALGIESAKDVIYILSEDRQTEKIKQTIRQAASRENPHLGCLFTIQADSFLKTGALADNAGEKDMNTKTTTQEDLITIIVNRGFADDAMAAARKAGAGGGTVINARGTAKEDDARFFGMHIVPEKEMLMIVVPHEKKDGVIKAIQGLECLSTPGSGIVFSSPAEDFSTLGKQSR